MSSYTTLDTNDFALEMDTYYMTIKNYEDMKSGKVPKVYIPINPSSAYSVPVSGVVIHYAPILGCIIKTPFESIVVRPERAVTTFASTMVYEVSGSLLEKSGLYTYICAGEKLNFFTGLVVRETLSASLHLKFIKGLSFTHR